MNVWKLFGKEKKIENEAILLKDWKILIQVIRANFADKYWFVYVVCAYKIDDLRLCRTLEWNLTFFYVDWQTWGSCLCLKGKIEVNLIMQRLFRSFREICHAEWIECVILDWFWHFTQCIGILWAWGRLLVEIKLNVDGSEIRVQSVIKSWLWIFEEWIFI